ncbi:hypothetical protein HDK64DRAFT_270388 [Phyllosticta capitalensis]|uniref:Uncharacterized protein n=1 Tax=Phyllosticta capitalensis TaxID=121624 RepID=A0ABR1YMM5_9PEZI
MADLHRATTRAAARKEIAAAASKATPKTNPTPSKRKRDMGENRKTPQKIFAGKTSASKDEDDELPSKLAKRISSADIARGAAMLREYQNTPTTAAAAAPQSAARATVLPSKTRWPDREPYSLSSPSSSSSSSDEEEVEEVEEDDDEGDDDDGDSDAQTPPNKHGKYENIHPTILRVIQAALERRFVIPVLEIINDMMKPEPASESQPSSDDDDDDNAGPSTLHRSDGPVFDHSSSDSDDMEDATASLPFRQQVLDLWDSVEADRQANPIQWPGGRSMAMAGARERMRRETERPVGASVFSAAPPTRGGGLFPPRPQASRGRRGW